MYMYYYESPMGVMKLCADEEGLLGYGSMKSG